MQDSHDTDQLSRECLEKDHDVQRYVIRYEGELLRAKGRSGVQIGVGNPPNLSIALPTTAASSLLACSIGSPPDLRLNAKYDDASPEKRVAAVALGQPCPRLM